MRHHLAVNRPLEPTASFGCVMILISASGSASWRYPAWAKHSEAAAEWHDFAAH